MSPEEKIEGGFFFKKEIKFKKNYNTVNPNVWL